MCSNYEAISRKNSSWVKAHFDCDLPNEEWRSEIYPSYPSPFIYFENGEIKCQLAQFGLVPHWATDKKKFGLRTYNARSETVHEKPSYRSAWKERRFGLAIMESFYEPNWETGKSVRWNIKRSDNEPIAVASIWESFIDKETGEIITSFSMLTINADGHEVMKHFHKPNDEKRSIVVLKEADYHRWLHAKHDEAKQLLTLAPNGFLESGPAPR
jgi:putative SOS response-associated peptidase YedK